VVTLWCCCLREEGTNALSVVAYTHKISLTTENSEDEIKNNEKSQEKNWKESLKSSGKDTNHENLQKKKRDKP